MDELTKKIKEEEQKPCIVCGSTESILATNDCHPLAGGDFAAEVLIVPLCVECRRQWFFSKEFRIGLIEKYRSCLDVISF